MFLETFLTTKTGRPIKEENISHWRRTVCGDLTSLFKPFDGAPVASLTFPPRDEFIEDVHKAQFKGLPGYSAIPASARAQGNYTELLQTVAKFQEPGIRTACPLNYELYVDAIPSQTANTLTIQMSAKNAVFGPKALGSPFMAYSYFGPDGFSTRAYALQAGDSLEDSWEFGSASDGKYHVRVDGPNGFMREFIGSALDPRLEVLVTYAAGGKALSGDLNVQVLNQGITSQTVVVTDLAYGAKPQQKTLKGGAAATFKIASSAVSGWYDFRITTTAAPAFVRNCAGRVETGQWSTSDPQFGRI
jgi:phospholipase C